MRMMGPKGKKQRKSKRRGFRERIVLFLVWLLFFQICTPTFLPSQKFGTDLQVTCEITHLDEALPASSIVRPVPVTIGQGILMDDGSYHYCMTVLWDAEEKSSGQTVWSDVFSSFDVA